MQVFPWMQESYDERAILIKQNPNVLLICPDFEYAEA